MTSSRASFVLLLAAVGGACSNAGVPSGPRGGFDFAGSSNDGSGGSTGGASSGGNTTVGMGGKLGTGGASGGTVGAGGSKIGSGGTGIGGASMGGSGGAALGGATAAGGGGPVSLATRDAFAFEANEISPATVATVVTLNTWHHVAIVQDSTSAQRIYVDGVASTGTRPRQICSSTNPFHIGSPNGVGGFFQGSLDEVRFYNRALSPPEVSALYAGQQ